MLISSEAAEVIERYMAWFREGRERREAERAATLAGALVQALTETAKSRAQFGQTVGGWIKHLGDLSVNRSAQLMGARGGGSPKRKDTTEADQLREIHHRVSARGHGSAAKQSGLSTTYAEPSRSAHSHRKYV